MKPYYCACAAIVVASGLFVAGVDATSGPDLHKARHELMIAVERAERSLGEHQPGSGHTKLHMQQVLNVLEGQAGKHFNRKAENPGDGTGVVVYLEQAEQKASSDVKAAIAHAKTFVLEAIEHAHRSVEGAGVEETHKHAALAAGLLQAAAGRKESHSPVTGALAYAIAKKTS